MFHHSSRLQIIDQLVRGAANFAEKSAISFHLTCRTAQFIESLGTALHACWYSPKNCQKLAIRTLSNCQLEVEWFLNLLEVKNVPILTNSLVMALTNVVKVGCPRLKADQVELFKNCVAK